MDGESVERLMDIILQMKINLGHVTETLCQQSQEIREQLGNIFEQERKRWSIAFTALTINLRSARSMWMITGVCT